MSVNPKRQVSDKEVARVMVEVPLAYALINGQGETLDHFYYVI
jgi:hypothetical protein